MTAIGYVSILSFYRLYAHEVNLINVFSWFFIIYSIILIVSRPGAGKIQDMQGDLIISVVGIIAQSVGLFLILLVPLPITVIICAVTTALGFGTLNASSLAIVTRNAPEHRRQYAVSTFFIFCDAALGFGPAFLGLFVNSSYMLVYLISSIL